MNNPILYLYCEKTKELIEYNKVFSNEYERITHNTILENFIQRHLDNNDVVFITKNNNGDFVSTGITIRDYFINQNFVFSYEELLSRVPIPDTSKYLVSQFTTMKN